MDKIVTENLFLLEFLVDNVHLDPSVIRGIGDISGDTCVSVQFLDNPPLDICEDDFAPKRRYSQDSSNVKSGKSCLFSLTPVQANEATYQFDVNVTVFKKLQQNVEQKMQVGFSVISIVNLFVELIASVGMPANESGPTAKTLKDTFQILNQFGEYVGDIGIYIRMSCFGKLIVTQFQMNLDDKSVLFKDKEGHSLYRYKKAGQIPKNEDSSKSGAVCDLPACPARAPPCPAAPPSTCPEVCANPPPVNPASCYQEIGASMGGNALTIRVHKDRKLENVDGDEDSCCCGTNTTQTKKHPRAIGGGGCTTTEQSVAMKPGYDYDGTPNTPFSFKLGGCGMNASNNVTVVPPTSTAPDGTQYTELADPNRDVFILRIGKKAEKKDKKQNLELELCTPKGPDLKPIPKKETRDTQWDDADAGGGGGGKGGKGGSGGKGGKGGKGKGGNGRNGGGRGGKNGRGGKGGGRGGKNGAHGRGSKSDLEKFMPDYGNPHIIGGSKSSRPRNVCKSSSSYFHCTPLEISCCDRSTVLSCEAFCCLRAYKPISSCCGMWG